MAVIGIEYCEGNEPGDLGYTHVYLHLRDSEEMIFNSGNFIKDWYQTIREFLYNHPDEFSLVHSSSVDHFIMDGAPCDEAWVVFDKEGVASLVFEYPETDNRISVFVNENEKPTFEEYKKYCKEYSNEKQS